MAVFDPVKILNDARQAVPAVDWALGVGGVAAVGAIIAGLTGNNQAAIVVIGLIFLAMILLFAFATLIQLKHPAIRLSGIVLLWAVIIFFVVFLGFTVSSVATGEPCSWARVIQVRSTECPAGNTALETDPILSEVRKLSTEENANLRNATAAVVRYLGSDDYAPRDQLAVADALVDMLSGQALDRLSATQRASAIAALTAIPERLWSTTSEFSLLRRALLGVWQQLDQVVPKPQAPAEQKTPERRDLDQLLLNAGLQEFLAPAELPPSEEPATEPAPKTTTTAKFVLCTGQYEGKCPGDHTHFAGCGSVIEDVAAGICARLSQSLSRAVRTATVGGNQCGYALTEITCTAQQ